MTAVLMITPPSLQSTNQQLHDTNQMQGATQKQRAAIGDVMRKF